MVIEGFQAIPVVCPIAAAKPVATTVAAAHAELVPPPIESVRITSASVWPIAAVKLVETTVAAALAERVPAIKPARTISVSVHPTATAKLVETTAAAVHAVHVPAIKPARTISASVFQTVRARPVVTTAAAVHAARVTGPWLARMAAVSVFLSATERIAGRMGAAEHAVPARWVMAVTPLEFVPVSPIVGAKPAEAMAAAGFAAAARKGKPANPIRRAPAHQTARTKSAVPTAAAVNAELAVASSRYAKMANAWHVLPIVATNPAAMMGAAAHADPAAMAIVSKGNAPCRVPRIANANPAATMAAAEYAASAKETTFATTVHAWMNLSSGWIPTSNCLRPAALAA